jgi:hypothetical protein
MGSGMLNDKFPRPLQSENDEFSSDEAGAASNVASFVFEDIFPRVVVVSLQAFRSLPPPIDALMQQGDGNQLYVIEHRRLAYSSLQRRCAASRDMLPVKRHG